MHFFLGSGNFRDQEYIFVSVKSLETLKAPSCQTLTPEYFTCSNVAEKQQNQNRSFIIKIKALIYVSLFCKGRNIKISEIKKCILENYVFFGHQDYL